MLLLLLLIYYIVPDKQDLLTLFDKAVSLQNGSSIHFFNGSIRRYTPDAIEGLYMARNNFVGRGGVPCMFSFVVPSFLFMFVFQVCVGPPGLGGAFRHFDF